MAAAAAASPEDGGECALQSDRATRSCPPPARAVDAEVLSDRVGAFAQDPGRKPSSLGRAARNDPTFARARSHAGHARDEVGPNYESLREVHVQIGRASCRERV